MSARLVAGFVETIRQRRGRNLQRCVRACFLDGAGKLTFEGERVLADLRERSLLFGSAARRKADGELDVLELARIEGRREIVLRLINLLELDPLGIARLMEVDDA